MASPLQQSPAHLQPAWGHPQKSWGHPLGEAWLDEFNRNQQAAVKLCSELCADVCSWRRALLSQPWAGITAQCHAQSPWQTLTVCDNPCKGLSASYLGLATCWGRAALPNLAVPHCHTVCRAVAFQHSLPRTVCVSRQHSQACSLTHKPAGHCPEGKQSPGCM